MDAGMNEAGASPEAREPLVKKTLVSRILFVCGLLLVPIGVAGVILPLLPGVPFLIVAAACFARSSPRFEHWLVTHPQLGPGVVAWRERGVISWRSKLIALPMMALSAFFVIRSAAPDPVKIGVVLTLVGCALFVASRPGR